MEFNVDIEEYSKQLRDELNNMPHSVKFEAIVPPIDLEKKHIEIVPYTARTSNGGCNAVTIAMLLHIMEKYIEEELKKNDVKLAYTLVDSIIDHSEKIDIEIKKGEKDDK